MPNPHPIQSTAACVNTLRSDPTIVLIAAVREELASTIRRLRLKSDGPWFAGDFGPRHVKAIICGIGGKRACQKLDALTRDTRPDLVVHLGFAGALEHTLVVGQIVQPNLIINERNEAIRLGAAQMQPSGVTRRIAMLTVERVATSPWMKRQLHQKHQAVAVDMESHAVAHYAARTQLPLVALRAISDEAHAFLPPVVAHWVGDDGAPNLAAIAGYCVRRPWTVPALLRLRNNARCAADALAEEIVRLLEGPLEYGVPRA